MTAALIICCHSACARLCHNPLHVSCMSDLCPFWGPQGYAWRRSSASGTNLPPWFGRIVCPTIIRSLPRGLSACGGLVLLARRQLDVGLCRPLSRFAYIYCRDWSSFYMNDWEEAFVFSYNAIVTMDRMKVGNFEFGIATVCNAGRVLVSFLVWHCSVFFQPRQISCPCSSWSCTRRFNYYLLFHDQGLGCESYFSAVIHMQNSKLRARSTDSADGLAGPSPGPRWTLPAAQPICVYLLQGLE